MWLISPFQKKKVIQYFNLWPDISNTVCIYSTQNFDMQMFKDQKILSYKTYISMMMSIGNQKMQICAHIFKADWISLMISTKYASFS